MVDQLDFVTYDDVPGQEGTEVRAFLRDRGLPRRVITLFRAAPALTPGSPGKIVIGYARDDDPLVVDLASGRVELLASFRPGAPSPVNADLRTFVDCLVETAGRYPFYPPTRDPEQAEEAADALRARLETIDPTSTVDPDGFWAAFLDDVAVGDYD